MHLLNLARQTILTPANIQDVDVEKLMGHLLSAQVDAADIYFQSTHSESWVLEGGIVKEGHHSIEQGAGVRAVAGEKTGFAYSDRLEIPFLLEAINNVKAITRQGRRCPRAPTRMASASMPRVPSGSPIRKEKTIFSEFGKVEKLPTACRWPLMLSR